MIWLHLYNMNKVNILIFISLYLLCKDHFSVSSLRLTALVTSKNPAKSQFRYLSFKCLTFWSHVHFCSRKGFLFILLKSVRVVDRKSVV